MKSESRVPISAFVVCRDEVVTIRQCLRSLDICSEIIVVDSGSTDGTLDAIAELIAEGLPIRLIEQAWLGYAAQKQLALDATSNLWCLSLDADEHLDDELRAAILALPLDTTTASGFWMRRRDYLAGYGYPPPRVHARYLLRLVKKSHARFNLSQLVHEALFADGPTEQIRQGVMMHDRNMSVAEESAVLNRYSTLKAYDQFARGKRTNHFRIVLVPVWEFIKTAFGQRYVLCGQAGLAHAMLRAEYALLTEAKLFRLSVGDRAHAELVLDTARADDTKQAPQVKRAQTES